VRAGPIDVVDPRDLVEAKRRTVLSLRSRGIDVLGPPCGRDQSSNGCLDRLRNGADDEPTSMDRAIRAAKFALVSNQVL
jgi:hypothetical protein